MYGSYSEMALAVMIDESVLLTLLYLHTAIASYVLIASTSKPSLVVVWLFFV